MWWKAPQLHVLTRGYTHARESIAGILCSHQERMQYTRSEAGSLYVHEEHWSIELK